MKFKLPMLAAFAGLSLAGCATLDGTGQAQHALLVRNEASGAEAAPLAAAIKRSALATHAFRSVGDAGPGTVVVSLDSIRPATLRDGSAGFTYLVTWQRDGVQIGRQEDDCAADEIRACGRDIAETMYAQVYYFDRRVRS